MTPRVRPATRDDAVWLSTRLREEDTKEVQAATGKKLKRVLIEGMVTASEAYVAEVSAGEPFVYFGRHGNCAWLLATDEVLKHRLWVHRQARQWIDRWLEATGKSYLYNRVYLPNRLHVRWLKALGAKFPSVPDGDFQMFYLFARRDSACASQPQ